jgi:superfamily I DNA/RNA helicase
LLLVDEFQDFNKLEVSLIDLLSSKSATLVAGDDDQALYVFKDAGPVHIRERYIDPQRGYQSFSLIHCCRCNRTIVAAFNDVLNSAIKLGYLKNRVKKEFKYFDDPNREEECKRHSKLVHIEGFSTQLAYIIETQISKIALERLERFSVLVIAPTRNQCGALAKGLLKRGFLNVAYVQAKDDRDPGLFDGLQLLVNQDDSNLGWRIAARHFLSEADFVELLKKTEPPSNQRMRDIVGTELKLRIRKSVTALKRLQKGQDISRESAEALFSELSLDPIAITQKHLQERLTSAIRPKVDHALRNIEIRISTIQGSKGLSEDYVFITHFDDRFFLEANGEPSDQKICNFLVALSRARTRVMLVSCQRKEPTLLGWIDKARVERLAIQA